MDDVPVPSPQELDEPVDRSGSRFSSICASVLKEEANAPDEKSNDRERECGEHYLEARGQHAALARVEA